jgi:hypothetical protein
VNHRYGPAPADLDLNKMLMVDLLKMFVRDRLGWGCSRNTYVLTRDPTKVVKIEAGTGDRFQNVLEWQVWQRIKDTNIAKYFAPCYDISPWGSALIMARTTPAPENKYPEKMPSFLSDFKRQNYGLLNGKLVCHDYGTNLLYQEGMKVKLRKVVWWDDDTATPSSS